MAHMVETMAYAGELPWHGLGVKVDDGIGVDDMIKEAGLDWNVEKIPAYSEFNGEQIYSGHDMLIRSTDGQPLDMVKENWIPVQNSETSGGQPYPTMIILHLFPPFAAEKTEKIRAGAAER